MNLTEKLTYINEKGQSIEFSVKSPFFCSEISGQDGIKNNIYTSKGAGRDGVTVTGESLDVRNIVVQGTVRGDKERNRLVLLAVLNPKLKSKLVYINGGVEKYIPCMVEKAPTITKEVWPKFLISFYCANPYWQDTAEAKAEIALWVGDFSFPLEILEAGIGMGHREPSLIVNTVNEGDVPCGMRVEFKALATLTNPSILNVNTQEFIRINKTMVAGEVLSVTTGFGNKKVESTLNGIKTNAFNFIDISSTFLQLDVGDNLFRYNADTNIDNLEVSIYYQNQYLGV